MNKTSPLRAVQELMKSRISPAVLTLGCLLAVGIIAWFNFVANRSDPPHLFWDENYHVTAVERYIENIAQFESHPPLGKLLIAIGESLSGANSHVDKHVLVLDKHINEAQLPKGFVFTGMRLMPGLFAAFGALIFFGLMYELIENRAYALLFTSLYLFENAFVVHFRATHLDSFQMFFSLCGLWFFVRLWKKQTAISWWQYAFLGVFFALAVMVKVNAICLLILFPILYVKDARQHPKDTAIKWLVDFLAKSGSSAVAILFTIFAVFYVHALNSRNMPDSNSSAGQKDIGFMSPEYRHYLEHHEALTPKIVYVITRDYFHFMEVDNKGVPKLDVTKPGENGSAPLHWPFHDRNINYRWDSANGKTSYVQLVGNQAAWYCGTLSVFLSLILIINNRVLGIPPRGSMRTYHLIEVFTGTYVTFMLLHLWIITQRVMYLYHYFIGLTISYVLLALMWKYLSEIHSGFERHKGKILAGSVSIFILSYFFFLPLTNHYPLTKAQCELRNIGISHILDCN